MSRSKCKQVRYGRRQRRKHKWRIGWRSRWLSKRLGCKLSWLRSEDSWWQV
jgi:hypothetical protein